MADKINATDLSTLLAEDVDSTYNAIIFKSSGDTYQVEFIQAVVDAVAGSSIYAPYKTTSDISSSGSGTTIQIPLTYTGDISNVAVWDGDILLRPTIVKGNDGTYDTVTIITNKAYTGARITVTFE